VTLSYRRRTIMIRSLILPTCCLGFTASFRMATTNAPSLYNYRQSSYSTTRHFSLSNTSSYSQEEAQIIQETLPSPLIDSRGNAFESAELLPVWSKVNVSVCILLLVGARIVEKLNLCWNNIEMHYEIPINQFN